MALRRLSKANLMRKTIIAALLLSVLCAAAHASATVHIALKATAAVVANSDGFFSLGSVAVVTGGTPAERQRLCNVTVGRAPLPNEVRHLTQGDIRLKLRQAGYRPNAIAVVEGADQSEITVSAAPSSAADTSSSDTHLPPASTQNGAPSSQQTAAPSAPLVHAGDAVSIVIQNGGMTITARGVAREAGKAGDRIHVHREGVMTDLMATIIDAQTVQMEL